MNFIKISLLSLMITFFANASEIIVKESRFSGEETVNMIKTIIKNKGLKIFKVIDHQKEAKNVGLKLQFETLIIFGNPKVGTKFMQENPLVGLELPLKILVFEKNQKTFIAYKDPKYMIDTYKLEKYKGILNKISKNLNKLTNKFSK